MRTLPLLLVISLFPVLSVADEQINLQWSICDTSPSVVLEKLGAADTELSKKVEITYYDSNPPIYTQTGLSFRTKVKNDKTESVVKVRFPQVPADVPASDSCE
ncbi:MAG: hypothetical protein P4M08_03335 [Oligoflexia bacterium]|nr:hypothetical protein [Oligoflexia bacterium]